MSYTRPDSVASLIRRRYPECVPEQADVEEQEPKRTTRMKLIGQKLRELAKEPDYELEVMPAADWAIAHPKTDEELAQEQQRGIGFKPVDMGHVAIELDMKISEIAASERTPEHAV